MVRPFEILWHWIDRVAQWLMHYLAPAFRMIGHEVSMIAKPMSDVMHIASGVGGFLGGAAKAIGLAEGGVVTKPTHALVGESGPEAVIPLSKMGSMGGMGGHQITVNVASQASPVEIGREIAWALKTRPA